MANRTMVSPNRDQRPQCLPLARQGSVYNYNRTFDEVQSQLGNTGKRHSMNLDELLKNVISAETGQLLQNPSSSSSASFVLGNIDLNGNLSKKTINEVWKEIVHQQHVNRLDNQFQQSSLGQTTLEDLRAGAINIGNKDNINSDAQPINAIDPMIMVSQQADWLPLQMQMQLPDNAIQHQQEQQQQRQQQQIRGWCPDFSVSKSVYENPVMKIGYSEKPLAISMPMAAMSSTSSDSQAAAVERKRRYADEMLEKTIERRQKRMMKNRESAARSRARKQAYTNQLENEKFRLQKINSCLKKLKEVEARLFSATTLMPKYQLRRTSSATF